MRKMRRRVMENNRTRERQKTLRAVIISIVVHILLALFIGAIITLQFELPPPPEEEEEPIELTIIDPPPPPEPPKPSYIDTTAATEADKPTENSPFESDRNTVAASQLPATGQAPVPTQEGENTTGLEFQNRNYSDGRPSQPAPPPSQPSQPAPQTPPQPPQPTPPPTPQPTPQPTATPAPQATPRTNAQLALLEPPKPQEQPKPTPQKPAPQQPAQPPRPQTPPQPPSAPGYQPQTRITRIQGNISNRGRSSVAANATPLGRYKKQLSDAIGSRWYYYVNRDMSLLTPGTLQVTFIVTAEGKVQKIEVVRNSSNETFAACSVSAIMDAELPVIPKDLIPMLEGNRLQIDYSFTILSN